MTDVVVGDVLDGKYRIEAAIGRGGMGAVFRAVHIGTSRTVALKVVTPRLASQPEFLRRFQREAHACGQLRHPNIVDVTDFGVANHQGDQLAYLVMEYLDGCTLAEALAEQPKPPLAWCVEIIGQVASAVGEAHDHGILHRDLKPDNIWLEPNRRGGHTVKVLDFGLAKSHGPLAWTPPASSGRRDFDNADTLAGAPEPTAVSLSHHNIETLVRPSSETDTLPSANPFEQETQAGVVVGTPAYMSPEQVRGAALTPRSDVYSLGVIAYRMFAGAPPFAGDTQDILRRQLSEAPQPLRQRRADLPVEAADLIMATLSKDPGQRPPSAIAFSEMLAARFESTGVFLHRGLMTFVAHLGTWIRLSSLAFLPLLVLSCALAIAAVVHAIEPSAARWVTSPTGRLGMIAAFTALIGVGLLILGVIVVPPMMQVLAAPLRPLEPLVLLRACLGRIRQWWTTVLPFLLASLAFFGWSDLSVRVVRAAKPFLSPLFVTLSLLLLILAPFLIVQVVFRRWGGTRGLQFLSTVVLVEGLTGRDALRRAADLHSRASAALRPLAIIALSSGVVGAALMTFLLKQSEIAFGRGLGIAIAAPFAALLVTVSSPFSMLLIELIYVRARRSSGESLLVILGEFEKAVLPPTHWQMAQRERIAQDIRLST